MHLLFWIILGICINSVLLRDELEKNHESLVSGGTVILMRSISGGMFSNFLFDGGIGSLGFTTFLLAGVIPLLILLAAKLLNHSPKSLPSNLAFR